nr:CoA pyrophosphatase [Acuticoccus kalidii]
MALAPPDPRDPKFVDLVWRAQRLEPTRGHLRSDVQVHGDHVLNPQFAPNPSGAPLRRAAVLMALAYDEDGELAVILTERAKHLSAHAGQIALPGGKIEAGETPTDAALREAMEEVALPPDAVQPLGVTEPYATRTGFFVIPVLGALRRSVVLHASPDEVAAAFTAPWSLVMSGAAWREVTVDRDGTPRRYYETMYGDRRIWGVTAGIFKAVGERLYRS